MNFFQLFLQFKKKKPAYFPCLSNWKITQYVELFMSISTNWMFRRQRRINSLLPFERVKIMAAKADLEVTKAVRHMQRYSMSKPTVTRLQIFHLNEDYELAECVVSRLPICLVASAQNLICIATKIKLAWFASLPSVVCQSLPTILNYIPTQYWRNQGRLLTFPSGRLLWIYLPHEHHLSGMVCWQLLTSCPWHYKPPFVCLTNPECT